MSKFRRVSELTTPDYLSKAVDNNYQADPYEYLKKTAGERKQKIAKTAQAFKSTKTDEPYAWEKAPEPEHFQDYLFPRNEEELNQSTLGSNSKIVRKAETAYDKEYSARDVESMLKPFSDEQYMNAMMRGASIWLPDMEEIVDSFKDSQFKNTEAAMVNSETLELYRRSRHEKWEESALAEARGRKYSSSRANPLLRTSAETTAGGRVGLINWDELDQNERQRLEIRENRRKASKEIKQVGRSREEVHQAWEDDLDIHSTNMRDYYSSNGVDLDIN